MADYDVGVSVKIENENKLDALERKIESLQNKPLNIDVKLTANAADITRQLNRQLGGKLGIDARVDISTNIDKKAMSKAMSQAQNMVNASMRGRKKFNPIKDEFYLNSLASGIQQRLRKIDSASSSKKYSKNYVDGEIALLKSDLKTWDQIIAELDPSDLPSKMRHSLALTQKAIDEFFIGAENRQLDLNIDEQIKKETDEAKAALTELRSVLKDTYSKKGQMIGLDSGSLEYKELDKAVAGLESHAAELESKLSKEGAEAARAFKNSLITNLNIKEARHIDLGFADEAKKEAAEAEAAFKKMRASLKKAYSLEREQLKYKSGSPMYTELQKQIDDAYISASKFKSEISGGLQQTWLDIVESDAKEAASSIDIVIAKSEEAKRKRANEFSSDLTHKYADLNKIDERFDKLGSSATKFERIRNKLAGMQTEIFDVVSRYKSSGDPEELLQFMDKYNTRLKEADGLLKSAESRQRAANRRTKQSDASLKLDNAKKTLGLQIDSWLTKNSAAADMFGDRLSNIKNRITDVNDAASLGALKSEFQQVTLEANKMGKATLSIGDRLKEQAKQYSAYLGVAAITAAGTQALSKMARNVLEVDTAMTGLYRVTDLTAGQYDALYSNMIASAKEYGTTLKDTIDATSDWVRAGFDANTSLGLADVTAMYQHISDLDYDEASKNLLTAYNGFKDTFSKDFGSDSSGVISSVEHVADAFNELDNKFSVTSAGLGEGLARSASALQMAGNTFEESAALIGATAEVQQDPEKAGQAMKTLSLRIRGMKGELEELGEESEGVENISKMQGQILKMTKGKVNIFDGAGDFRSTYDIMKDIASIYDELSSTDQANLLETLAGKNRANDVAALIGNFQTAIDMVETAENAAGSAAAENAKYVDSLQGRLDIMTASFQAMSTSVLDSDVLKGGVSVITALIDGFTKLVDTVGILPTILGGVATGFSLFNKGIASVDRANGKFKLFGKTIEEIKGIFGTKNATLGIDKMLNGDDNPFANFADRLKKDEEVLKRYQDLMHSTKGMASQGAIDNALAGASDDLRAYVREVELSSQSFNEFSASQKKQQVTLQASNRSLKSASSIIAEYKSGLSNVKMDQKEFVQAVSTGNPVLGKYLKSVSSGKASIFGYGASLVGATLKTVGLTIATTALNAVLTMGIGVAIGAVITGISSLINHYDDLAESVDESSNAFNESNSSLMKNAKGFKEAANEYDKLKHGVNSVGENIGLSADEFDRYHDAVNKIAELAPSMVSGFDAQGNAILNNVSSVNDLTDAYAELIAAEAKAFIEGDEEKGYAGARKVAEDYIHEMNSATDVKIHKYDKYENDTLRDILDGTKKIEDLKDADIHDISKKLGLELESGGLPGTADYDKSAKNLEKYIKENVSEVRKIVDEYDSEYQALASSMKDTATAFLNTELYDKDSKIFGMSDSIKNSLSKYVGNLDQDFFESIYNDAGGNADKAIELLESKISGIVDKFANMGKSQQKQLEEAFNLKSDFDSGEINMKEFSDKVNAIDKMLDDLGLDSEEKKQFMVSLGFEYDGDGNLKTFTKEYEAALARFGGDKASKELKNWLETLSGQDLNIIANMELTGEESIDRLKELLDLEKALQNVDKIDINVETESLEKLNTALKESTDATGLTQESIEAIKSRYADLDGFDAAAIFEKTTTGVRLNTKALNSLEEQYINTKKAANDQNLSTLAKEYQRLGEEIEAAKKAGDSKSVDNLTSQQTAISDAIKEAQMLASAYDGMTSSYKQWLDAQSSGQEGDRYASILSGRENAEKLAKEGKWGNTELQGYVEMFTSPDVELETPQQYADAWGAAIKKSNRYFQEGKQGINNYLSDVHKANSDLVKMNKDGSFEIQPGFDTEEWAKASGMAESSVEAMFGMMSEYGVDVPIGIDEASIEDLAEKAKSASNALKSSMGDDFEIKVNTDVTSTKEAETEIDNLKAQRDEINNSSATVEVKQNGVDAVNSSIEAVINKKIELEQPAYMQLNASQVKSTMTEALSALQDYQNAVDEVSRLQGLQDAGIKIDTSQLDAAKGKIDEAAKAIAELDGSVKMAIGLDASDGVDAIKQKIENGEVKLTVDTDIDESATEQLASNIEKIKDKDVTIKVKVDGLDDVKDLTKSIELATSIDGNVDALSKFSDAANGLNDVSDNIVKTVTADVYGNLDGNRNLDSLDKFTDSAEKLDDIESSYVTVTANVKSNLVENADNVNKLETFAKGAEALQGISSSDVSVKANLDANIGGILGYNDDLDNIEKFAESAERLSGVPSADVSVKANLDANVGGILGYNADLDNLDKFADSARNLAGISNADVSVKANLEANTGGILGYNADLNNLDKFADAAERLGGIGSSDVSVKAHLDANVGGILGYNADLNNLDKFTESAKKLADVENASVTVDATLNANTGGILGYNADLNNLDRFIDGAKKLEDIDSSSVTVDATLNANTGGILGYNADLNNLDKFADGAKKLEDIESSSVTVDATLNANTGGILGYNPDLDNLDKFSDAAKKLEDIESSNVVVTAKLDANTGGFLGSNPDLDNLDKFVDAAKKLEDVKGSDVTVNATLNANTGGFLGINPDLDNLDKFADAAEKLDGIKGSDVTVAATLDADIDGDKVDDLSSFVEGAEKLQDVDSKEVNITANLQGDIDSDAADNLSAFADGAKKLQGVGDASSTVTANLKSEGVGNNLFGNNSALDNIEKFANAAKSLKNVGDASVTITANLKGEGVGNNILGSNSTLDNLDKFTDSAKKLKNVGDASVTVTANLEGNGVGNNIFGSNSTLDNLGAFAEGAKKLKGVENVSATVTANLNGNIGNNVLGSNSKLSNLSSFTEGAEKLKNVNSKTVNIEANLKGNLGSSGGAIENLPAFASTASDLQGVSSNDVSITANVNGNLSDSNVANLSEFKTVASNLPPSSTVTVNANVDTDGINSAKTSLQGLSDSGVMHDYNANVNVAAKVSSVDDTAVQNYQTPPKDGKVTYTVDSSQVDSWDAPNKTGVVNYSASVEALTDAQKYKTGTITYKAKVEGAPVVDGTAHVNGTAGSAFKQGSWSTKESGTALMGELGRELIVRDGRFFTVGDNGAEFAKYQKGDIIFNHKQTEELFKNGYVTSGGGRGRALAEGTAFANVGGATWNPGGIKPSGGGGTVINNYNYNVSSGSSKSTKSSPSKNAEKEAEKFEEVIDWIEVALDRIERAIKNLDTVASSVFRSWTERTSALNKQIAETRNEIDLQQRAYDRYMKAANEVGLDAGWAQKVRDGKVDIELITDEGLKEKVDQYKQWYEKALDARDAIIQLKEAESELYKQRFDNVSDKFDGYLGVIQHEKDMLDEFISQSEMRGWLTSQKYYEALSKNTQNNIAELEKKRAEMTAEMNAAVDSGKIEKGSEAWYEMVNEIDSVTLAIEQGNTELLEFQKTMRELDWEVFDLIQGRISNITKESDFLIELMSNKKLFEDNGQLTDEGQATMGLHGVNYNTYMAQSDKYAAEIKKLDSEIAKDPYNKDLINRRQELLELQQESILSAEDEKNAIRDLVEQGIEKELDSLSDLIDKRNEALDSAKD